jgi:hypothetical protein
MSADYTDFSYFFILPFSLINNFALKDEVYCSARYGFYADPYPGQQILNWFKRPEAPPSKDGFLGMDPPANQSTGLPQGNPAESEQYRLYPILSDYLPLRHIRCIDEPGT